MTQNWKSESLSSVPGVLRSPGTLAVIAALAVGGVSIFTVMRNQVATTKTPVVPVVKVPEVRTVTALGRLEPKEEVVKISAPASSAGAGNRVEKLLVKEGDSVKTGQVIAIMDNRDRLQASLKEAQQQVEVDKARLGQVKAGAKQGELVARQADISRFQAELGGQIKTQDAEIARLEAQLRGETATTAATIKRLEAELQGQQKVLTAIVARVGAEKRNAQAEVERYNNLYKEGVISNQEVDRRRLSAETSTQQVLENQANQTRAISTLEQQIQEAKANREKSIATLQQQIQEAKANREKSIATIQQQINQAKGTLNQTAEVRPTDIITAQAEVKSAEASVERIRAELAQAYVKAPRAGQILKIHTRAGEAVSSDGIVELGQTDQMYAVVEVYQSDINKVLAGQKVRLLSESLPSELQGNVDWVGWQIQRQNIVNSDPSSNIDSRVVEVHVRLDNASTQKAAKFTNLQVRAVIELDKARS
jgi:HlyD family secretion protein